MNPKKLKEKIYDSDIHIRKRLFVVSVTITVFALFISLVEIALTDSSISNVLLLAGGLLLVVLIARFSLKRGHTQVASIISAAFMGFFNTSISTHST